jgi:hypothetical protein
MLSAGTRIIATKNFGRIREGMLGVITGTAEVHFFFWKRTMYLCTFVGNFPVAAKPAEIDDFDHGYDLCDFEKPDFLPDPDLVLQRVSAKWRV